MKEQIKIELEKLHNAQGQFKAACSRNEKWTTAKIAISNAKKWEHRIKEIQSIIIGEQKREGTP